jgi:Uma2 family endonuclease
MAIPAKKLYTPEEYLVLEERAEQRSEYYDGEIFAMAGDSANHNQIVINLAIALESAFEKKPCRVFATDMRLLVTKSGLYTYPDVMVVCGKLEFVPGRNDTVTNPILIVEVLSESTQGYDRTTKFRFYRQIPSLQEYVLIDQARAYVECFRKMEGGRWVFEAYDQLEDSVALQSLDLKIPLARIYNKVEWEGGVAGGAPASDHF